MKVVHVWLYDFSCLHDFAFFSFLLRIVDSTMLNGSFFYKKKGIFLIVCDAVAGFYTVPWIVVVVVAAAVDRSLTSNRFGSVRFSMCLHMCVRAHINPTDISLHLLYYGLPFHTLLPYTSFECAARRLCTLIRCACEPQHWICVYKNSKQQNKKIPSVEILRKFDKKKIRKKEREKERNEVFVLIAVQSDVFEGLWGLCSCFFFCL